MPAAVLSAAGTGPSWPDGLADRTRSGDRAGRVKQGEAVSASAEAQSDSVGRLVTDFVRNVAGVAHAVVIGGDGVLLAASSGLSREHAQQLTDVATGLMRLAHGAADSFKGGAVTQTVIEMELGYLFLMSITGGACLAALASPRSELGAVAYEMTLLVDHLGPRLAPGADGNDG